MPDTPSLDLPDADGLLVVPPMARLNWPALGVHQLQACAREAGFEVGVLYLNLLFGDRIGVAAYERLNGAPDPLLLGDRLFARAAWGTPPLGRSTEGLWQGDVAGDAGFTEQELLAWEGEATALIDQVARAIGDQDYAFVGASTTFDQTGASLALLHRVKALRPGTPTLLGGANCEGEMAEGIASVAEVDHVFSGESEAIFVRFLEQLAAGERPAASILRGRPQTDLDALPTPRFDAFFDQLDAWLPGFEGERWLTFETSRGCWWGQKHHCTFCGLNGTGMGFREKSADRALEQLRAILAAAPTRRVFMTDNIMPHRYHRTFVPRVRDEVGEVHLFYEQKANLTLAQVKALHDAGTHSIQPGIEALDTELLDLVRKGVKARQNIALLRYARSLGMGLHWNLLWGLPGDAAAPYERTLQLLPLLRHLNPPLALNHVSIDRFSPYFDQAETFGVTGLRPLRAYAEVFPAGADLPRLAYHFEATWDSGSKGAVPLMSALNDEVRRWHEAWEGDPNQRPALAVQRTAPGRYVLVDTRGLGGPSTLYLDEGQAQAVLAGGPLDKVARAAWAIAHRYAVDRDGWCVPLAVAPHALLAEMEARPAEVDQPQVQVIAPL